MRESTIEKAVCAYAKLKGCLIIKLAGQNQRGQPDRLFIRAGRCLFVEFKAPGKHPTALQLKWLSDLQSQGMTSRWCDDIEQGKQLIDIIFP
ncbi:VRR-NUC domain containing protein [uncultured Caudovirales phage]|uniref:VRR-NUC domain containing protein n=1 Tax=uncultured Caudovirales phage TaxID=2100421 RepID=A0A6J5N351_9CAUD|nr:VRR-NUC domain containing protein [uncultured Caudovirales phage]